MPHKTIRRQRAAMWRRDPRCYYCRVVTVLPKAGPPKGPTPANLATIDHLRPRHHPGRLEPLKGVEFRRVLSCWKCNNERDTFEHEIMPREKLWKMCGSVPLSMKSLEELLKAEQVLATKQPRNKRDRESVNRSLEAVREAIAERRMCDGFQEPSAGSGDNRTSA